MYLLHLIIYNNNEVCVVLDQNAKFDLHSATSLKQYYVGRHVAPFRHINMISSQPVFALSPLCYVLSGDAVNNNCISCLFDSIDQGFTRGEHANLYTTKAVFNNMKNAL